jgi:hypothetical protein
MAVVVLVELFLLLGQILGLLELPIQVVVVVGATLIVALVGTAVQVGLVWSSSRILHTTQTSHL